MALARNDVVQNASEVLGTIYTVTEFQKCTDKAVEQMFPIGRDSYYFRLHGKWKCFISCYDTLMLR